MKLYIVEMQRWGDTETHHYIMGVFTSFTKAQEVGEVEKTWRGGKYEPNITEVEVDSLTPDFEAYEVKLAYHKECTDD